MNKLFTPEFHQSQKWQQHEKITKTDYGRVQAWPDKMFLHVITDVTVLCSSLAKIENNNADILGKDN